MAHEIGLIMFRDVLLGKRRASLRILARTSRASSILQMGLMGKVVFSSFFCDHEQLGLGAE